MKRSGRRKSKKRSKRPKKRSVRRQSKKRSKRPRKRSTRRQSKKRSKRPAPRKRSVRRKSKKCSKRPRKRSVRRKSKKRSKRPRKRSTRRQSKKRSKRPAPRKRSVRRKSKKCSKRPRKRSVRRKSKKRSKRQRKRSSFPKSQEIRIRINKLDLQYLEIPAEDSHSLLAIEEAEFREAYVIYLWGEIFKLSSSAGMGSRKGRNEMEVFGEEIDKNIKFLDKMTVEGVIGFEELKEDYGDRPTGDQIYSYIVTQTLAEVKVKDIQDLDADQNPCVTKCRLNRKGVCGCTLIETNQWSQCNSQDCPQRTWTEWWEASGS